MHVSAMVNAETFKLFLEKTFPGRKLKVLDVGGLNVNGSVRPLFEQGGHEFCCLDMNADESVDVVSPPGEPFPFVDGKFDAVVSTSVEIKMFRIRSTWSNSNGFGERDRLDLEISRRDDRRSKNEPKRPCFERDRRVSRFVSPV